MKWLEGQLKNAKKDMKVQLIMHIPPGADVSAPMKKPHGHVLRPSGPAFLGARIPAGILELVKDYPGVLVSGSRATPTWMASVFRTRAPTAPFFIDFTRHQPIRGNNPGFQSAPYDRGSGDIKDWQLMN